MKFRRLVIVTAAVAMLGGGAWLVRQHQVDARVWDYRRQGLEAWHHGDDPAALRSLGRVLQRRPDDAEVLWAYAQARQRVQEPDGDHLVQAMRALEHLLALKPEHADACHALLDLYQRCQLSTETLSLTEAWLSHHPDDRSAVHARTVALLRMHRADEALAVAMPYVARHERDLDMDSAVLELMARCQRPPAQIIAQADRLRRAHPADAGFQALRSIASSLTGDTAGAGYWADQAVAHASSLDEQGAQLLIRQLDALDRSAAVVTALRCVVDSAATPPDAIVDELVERLIRTGKPDEAVAVLDRHTSGSASSRRVVLRAWALDRSGHRDQAVAAAAELGSAHAPGSNVREPQMWSGVLDALIEWHHIPAQQVSAQCATAEELYPDDALVRLANGRAFARIGDDNVALQRYREAYSQAPGWAEPLLCAGDSLLRLGRPDEALAAARAARDIGSDALGAMVLEARALQAGGAAQAPASAAELLSLLQRIHQIEPLEPRTLPMYVELLARSGQSGAAATIVHAALASNSPPPGKQTLLDLARTGPGLGGEVESACLDRCQQLYGADADVTFVRADLMRQAGDAPGGLKLLDQARAAAGGDRNVAWAKATARYDELIGDPRARSQWAALCDLAPTDVDVHWMAISARSVRSDEPMMRKLLGRIRALTGDRGLAVRLSQAQWLMTRSNSQEDASEAAVLLGQIAQSAPGEVSARLMLADCLERMGNISGAVDQLSIASSLVPDSAVIRLELARLRQQQCDFDQAAAQLAVVTGSTTATPAELRLAAGMLASQGDADAALRVLERLGVSAGSGGVGGDGNASRRGPSGAVHPDLLLAHLYAGRREFQKADAIYRQLLAQPTPLIIARAADYYAATGRTNEALQVLGGLDHLAIGADLRAMILGDFYRHCGQTQAADAQYRAAVAANTTSGAAWRRLIAFELAGGQAEAALDSCRRAAAALPADTTFATVLQQSQAVQQLSSNPVARPLLMSLLNADDAPIAVQSLSLILRSAQEHADAAKTLQRLGQMAQRYPKLLALQVYVAQGWLDAAQPEQAAAVASQAALTFPDVADAARIAAISLGAAGRWSEVASMADRWARLAPAQALAADVWAARAALECNNPAQAIDRLAGRMQGVHPGMPAWPEVAGVYAAALVRAGRTDQAESWLAPDLGRWRDCRALWMDIAARQIADPQTAATWLRRLEPLVEHGTFAEQVGLLEAWHAVAARSAQGDGLAISERSWLAKVIGAAAGVVSPGDAPLLVTAGTIASIDGQPDPARALYRRALSLNPSLPVARNNLALLLMNDPATRSEALELARAAVAATSGGDDHADFLDTLSQVQARMGDSDASIGSLQAACALRPSEVLWQTRLADLLLAAGRTGQARDIVDRLWQGQSQHASLNPELRQRLTDLRAALGVASDTVHDKS